MIRLYVRCQALGVWQPILEIPLGNRSIRVKFNAPVCSACVGETPPQDLMDPDQLLAMVGSYLRNKLPLGALEHTRVFYARIGMVE